MLTRVEELKLIAKCALADDRRAFGTLVEEYQSGVRHFLLNLTLGDASLSDDLAQETFLKAYTNIRSFKGLSKFSTWLYRIAYNEFYSYTRKRKEERIDEDENISNIGGDEQIGTYEEGSNAQMDVNKAMKVLSEVERSVITLYYMEDQPLKKISEITSLPEGTIKSHLSRAREKMSKVLKN